MKQIEVSQGNRKMVTWTEEDPKLKSGNCIRFKDQNEFWYIDKVHEKSLEKGDIKRDWHVGGL